LGLFLTYLFCLKFLGAGTATWGWRGTSTGRSTRTGPRASSPTALATATHASSSPLKRGSCWARRCERTRLVRDAMLYSILYTLYSTSCRNQTFAKTGSGQRTNIRESTQRFSKRDVFSRAGLGRRLRQATWESARAGNVQCGRCDCETALLRFSFSRFEFLVKKRSHLPRQARDKMQRELQDKSRFAHRDAAYDDPLVQLRD
jgi:hypothetical protein